MAKKKSGGGGGGGKLPKGNVGGGSRTNSGGKAAAPRRGAGVGKTAGGKGDKSGIVLSHASRKKGQPKSRHGYTKGGLAIKGPRGGFGHQGSIENR
jgi:hypothetical protein